MARFKRGCPQMRTLLLAGTSLEQTKTMDIAQEPSAVEWYAIVADDDDDCRALLASTLRRAHLQVCEACDGEELLQRYDVLSVLVGKRLVVVSDIGMPFTDGIAATRMLRHRSAQLPIMLVTAFRDERITEAAHAAGANLVLSKPLSANSLLNALDTVLPGQVAAAESTPMTKA